MCAVQTPDEVIYHPQYRFLMITTASIDTPTLRSFRVLGVRVHAVQIPDVIAEMERWISVRDKTNFIAVTGMHGVAGAQGDASLRQILNAADMVVPDGMPLVWLGRRRGFALARRVYGPELMLDFLASSERRGYRHFLYGGADGVPEKLASRLLERFPRRKIVGMYSPPFRPLNSDEEREVLGMINRAAPDVLWIGLSTPKQERWMYEYRDRLRVPVLVGVGAAFDICSGRTRQAPQFMREHGLEWLFRLFSEPRRLWRRYLLGGSRFAWNVLLEETGLKKFGVITHVK
jgi:N-acetylglucosaminyldiphosphoundecaprenol N-acetyl-beta-D-mannosaminyltransferase